MPNPDGTTQVAAPTRSAFAAEEPSKGKNQSSSAANYKEATNKDNTDKNADHEGGIIEGIKGLIRQHMGGSANKNEDSALKALDSGVSSAPGNTTDY
jgi:hypothetical protein